MKLFFKFLAALLLAHSINSSALELELSDSLITKDHKFTQKEITAKVKCNDCKVITAKVIGENKNFILVNKEKNGSKISHLRNIKIEGLPGFFQLFSSTPEFLSKADAEKIKLFNSKLSRNHGDILKEYFFEKKLYSFTPNKIEQVNESTFQFNFTIPSHTPVGNYQVEVNSFAKNRRLLNSTKESFVIKKSGFYNDVVIFSQNNSVLYATISVVLAILLGGIGGLTNLGMLRRTKAF